MNITLSTNISLWTAVQGLFTSKIADRTVLADASTPLGINRTAFMGHVIEYDKPVLPAKAAPTRHLISMFGIKQHERSFRKLTTASQNTFKSN